MSKHYALCKRNVFDVFFSAAKRMKRPAGVKGPYKIVDHRMKKDFRSQRANEKRNKKSGKRRRWYLPQNFIYFIILVLLEIFRTLRTRLWVSLRNAWGNQEKDLLIGQYSVSQRWLHCGWNCPVKRQIQHLWKARLVRWTNYWLISVFRERGIRLNYKIVMI